MPHQSDETKTSLDGKQQNSTTKETPATGPVRLPPDHLISNSHVQRRRPQPLPRRWRYHAAARRACAGDPKATLTDRPDKDLEPAVSTLHLGAHFTPREIRRPCWVSGPVQKVVAVRRVLAGSLLTEEDEHRGRGPPFVE